MPSRDRHLGIWQRAARIRASRPVVERSCWRDSQAMTAASSGAASLDHRGRVESAPVAGVMSQQILRSRAGYPFCRLSQGSLWRRCSVCVVCGVCFRRFGVYREEPMETPRNPRRRMDGQAKCNWPRSLTGPLRRPSDVALSQPLRPDPCGAPGLETHSQPTRSRRSAASLSPSRADPPRAAATSSCTSWATTAVTGAYWETTGRG